MSTESWQLDRLGELFAARGAPVEQLLRAIQVSGVASAQIGVFALSNRSELLVPRHPDVVAAVAPGTPIAESASRQRLLRLSVDGARVDVAVVHPGALAAREAIATLALEPVRAAWLAIVDPLLELPGAIMMNRNRYLTEQRGVITITADWRSSADEAALGRGIDQHLARIGLPGVRRSLWTFLYRASGPRRTLAMKTTCTSSGPTSQFDARTDGTQLAEAAELLQAITDPTRAKTAASSLERIAAGLDARELSSIEITMGPWSPDIIAWMTPGR